MLRILTYHRIADPDDYPYLNPRLISATPRAFEAQMEYVGKHYSVVSVEELVAALQHRAPLPAGAVLLTFDDATRDFEEFAWPVLRRLGLPAAVFVPTAFPDHPERSFWWDRLHRLIQNASCQYLPVTPLGTLPVATAEQKRRAVNALQDHLRSLPQAQLSSALDAISRQLGEEPTAFPSVLGWEQLRRMSKAGVTIAPHTRSHSSMASLSRQETRDEIVGSYEDVKNQIGFAPPVFSYPYGNRSQTSEAILKAMGCVAAFRMKHGDQLGDGNNLGLRRTNVCRQWRLPFFGLRLSRIGACYERWRDRRVFPSAPTSLKGEEHA